MRGLRALCCSQADQNNPDGHSSPNRPVHKIPEKDTPNGQNAPASVNHESSSTDVTRGKPEETPVQEPVEKPVETPEERPKQNPRPRNLWQEAYDGLDRSHQDCLPANDIPATDAIQGVIDTTTKKYEEWLKGGLRIHRKGKDDINIRDTTEKIIGTAMKAKDIISKAVSFDPTGHASSAWTVISFGMSVVQNRLDRRDAIFESSAYLTETLAWFAIVDAKYRDQGVDSDQNVDEALLRAYSAMLEFTAEVKKSQKENEGVRTWKSIFPLTDQALSTLKIAVNEQKIVADQWIRLAANLGDRERARKHLAKTDENLEATRRLEAKMITVEEETQLKWMSEFPFSDRQRFLQDKRTGDTGIWLLDSQEYNDWMVTPGDLLWLPGISGCGKSVLCSTVIHDLRGVCRLDPYKYVAYWYFQFDHKTTKSVYALTRSLIRQLSRPPLASSVVDLWKEHHYEGSQPDSQTILGVLDDVLYSIPSEGHVYLVFDALDECPDDTNHEREKLFSLLMGVLERHKDKVHILATSRPEQDIKEELEKFSRVDLEARLAEDVKTFVETALERRRLSRYQDGIKKQIADTLLSSKERRFRWAELQIAELETKHSDEDLSKALRSVPQTLEESYRKILDNVLPSDMSIVRDILMIICLSPVPLDVNTVASMAGIQFSEDVVPMCTSSLVNENRGKVQVAHFSVQEYLIVKEKKTKCHECQFTMIDGHKHLAEKSINWLLAQTDILREEDAVKLLPFLYATKHWDSHVAGAGGYDQLSPELQVKIDRLFTEPNVYHNWLRGADSDDEHTDHQWSKLPEECETPIHRAVLMHLTQTVDTLIAQGADPRLPSERAGPKFALAPTSDCYNLATDAGHLDLLEHLLDKQFTLDHEVYSGILMKIDSRDIGRARLAVILQKLWDQGGLRDKTDTGDKIKPNLVSIALHNHTSALDIMKVFLSWPGISIRVGPFDTVHTVMHSWSVDLVKLLFEECDGHVTREFFEEIRMQGGSLRCWDGGFAYLALERPYELPLSDNLVHFFARRSSSETMESLLRVRKGEFRVTTRLLEEAAKNIHGAAMIRLLWPLRESGTDVSDMMLMNGATNNQKAGEILDFFVKILGPNWNFESRENLTNIIYDSEDGIAALSMVLSLPALHLPVSEALIEAICNNRDAVGMLKLLRKERGIDTPITEVIVRAAVANPDGPSLFSYLTELSADRLPVTGGVILEAANSGRNAAEMLRILGPYAPDSAFTDELFQDACNNADALAVLLDQKRREPPAETMLDQIKRKIYGEERALQVLLERDILRVDEHLVETLANKFTCVDVLMSWKADFPVTEKALMTAAGNPRSMRKLMATEGNSSTITEDILIAAAGETDGQEVMEVILKRQGSLPITEKVVQAAVDKCDPACVLWLLRQQSESFVTKFWNDALGNPDSEFDFGSLYAVLLAFLLKTRSKLTEATLIDYPYDTEDGWNFGLDDVVDMLCTQDDYPGIQATEAVGEILIERCGPKAIRTFLDSTKISITENLIQAAKKNRGEDSGEVVELMEERRG